MTASWLYLAVAVWGSLFTLVSFRPPHRPGLFMAIGFFAAWLTTELAIVHLVLQIVFTVVFIWFGALSAWPGWVALALTIVSWCGLVVAIRQANGTDNVFASALAEAFGIHDAQARIERRRIWLPFWFRRRGVERIKNLSYVEDTTRRRHRCDIYRPKGGTTGAPVLLQIHGGAWVISNKDQQAMPLVNLMAARGWVCVSINYGLSPRITWPEHLVNCKLALAWIREHIVEYGGDPSFVAVTGGSAGGHLTAMMGLTANDPQWQPGFADTDTSVQAIVPFYGVYDWTASATKRDRDLRRLLERSVVKQPFAEAHAIYEAASPMNHVGADAPPALVIHGSLDTLVPVTEARAFVAALRAVSNQPVAYAELRGAHHGFDVFNSIRSLHTIAAVDLFLTWLVNADRSRAGVQSPPAADPIRSDEEDASATDPRSKVRTEP
jgi:acetyl esterase/lipase